jgi:ubiquinone/menaquinone biosynthesis C-methylase UbiE
MTLDLAFYDAELRLYNDRFRAAADVQSNDHVVDIGCGAGQTTRQAARAAGRGGSVLGVDVSAIRLEWARRLNDEEQLDNITYQCADAETYPFPTSRFHICISRFGTMFFADPVAAFTNLGRALRPGARLVMLVWQRRERNEWATAVDEALSAHTAPQPMTAPNPFSLADPTTARRILATAGFENVQLEDVREPVYYGADVDDAYSAVLDLWNVETRLAGLDTTTADRTLSRLRATIEARDTEAGVLFDSRAWIVSGINAQRRDT